MKVNFLTAINSSVYGRLWPICSMRQAKNKTCMFSCGEVFSTRNDYDQFQWLPSAVIRHLTGLHNV